NRITLREVINLLIKMPLRPHRSPIFPYTTLFRSESDSESPKVTTSKPRIIRQDILEVTSITMSALAHMRAKATASANVTNAHSRSEEHTSELQSRENLVCRLLLENKKRKSTATGG